MFQETVEVVRTQPEMPDSIMGVLKYQLFSLGNASITPLTIIYLILLSIVVVALSGYAKKLLINKLLKRTKLDIGAQQAIGTITRYLLVFFGFIVVLQTVGIDLTTLNVLAGAVGIGVGFGLQNVANNFISGLMILTERPIKVGDRIEVDKVVGRVTKIGPRSTTILTNANLSIIVPNSKFISESVVNWSLAHNMVRLTIPVAVRYSADATRVIELLKEIAGENKDVLDEPAPSATLTKLGETMMSFDLDIWTRRVHTPGGVKSALNLEIVKRFGAESISLESPPITIEQLPSEMPDLAAENYDKRSENSDSDTAH